MMKTNNRPCFPQRLFLLLKLVEEKGLDHVVSWVNDGSAFKVHDLKEFQDVLLPKYFSTKKYASFTRQLCAYGFSCLRTGRQTGIYSHPGFHRSDPAGSFQIRRESAKKTAKSHVSRPSVETPMLTKHQGIMKAGVPNVQAGIPQSTAKTFEFPAVFGSNGRYTSADHTNQLSHLHNLLCAPKTATSISQPTVNQTAQAPAIPHARKISQYSLPVLDSSDDSQSDNGGYRTGVSMDDLEPIPVFNWENALLPQKREFSASLNGFSSMFSNNNNKSNYVEPTDEELLAGMYEPQSISTVSTPI
ncbi:unnamed protein product [Cylindrotheca closterium]|uniref:HSF-type DNA-binding domain-containing protein n=1 Tax=Cylindrotheca closterium TaxID=2856 RepID=A0AAD2JKY0_9STRA|nr:unnamed protein product [Cylindrotheca closterium]